MKRLNAPKVRKVPRKRKKWAVTVSPGPHSGEESLPLIAVLRGSLKLARTKNEAEAIIAHGEVQVDGRVRRDSKYPVGPMDVVSFPRTGGAWRVIYDKRGHLRFCEIGEEEAQFKLVKVVRKSKVKGGKLQISLHDGKTLTDDFEDVTVGGTVKIGLPDFDFQDQTPLEKGNLAMVMGGSNIGKYGEIGEVREIEGPSSDQVVIRTERGEFQSPEDYTFVIGEEEPLISLPEGD